MNRGSVTVLRREGTNGLSDVETTRVPQSAYHVANVAEQQTCDGVRLADMVGGLAFREPGRDIELKTERRQVMAECVLRQLLPR